MHSISEAIKKLPSPPSLLPWRAYLQVIEKLGSAGADGADGEVTLVTVMLGP